MRLAVLGAGISGLTVSYRLGHRFDITLYEAEPRLGGHTHTVDVAGDDGPVAVDTGFIVYNERNYPRFSHLLAELDVATQPSVMSFGVHDEGTGIEYSGSNMSTLFAQPRNALSPRYWHFLREILRFNRLAQTVLTEAEDPSISLADFLDRHRFSPLFRNIYLLPMASAIWSTAEDRVGEFPLFAFVRFFANHGLIALSGRPQWRVVRGGSSRYVDAMLAKMAVDIRLDTPVAAVERDASGVTIIDANSGRDLFDAVVFACHPDEALTILGNEASDEERKTLAAIPYTRNSVVLHTDESVLPRARRAWSAWNYWCNSNDQTAMPTVTYSMNTLQNLQADRHYLVTLNRDDAVDDAHVLRRFEYSHPLYTVEGLAAQQRHAAISGQNSSYYCGAYWGYGFHEDGVVSAERVVDQLSDEQSRAAA
ncbi:MAG: FAD-dependent oxidoreductase [Pseudomonadota bacterium]